MTPRPSTKRGRRLLNQVSTELGEGHKGLRVIFIGTLWEPSLNYEGELPPIAKATYFSASPVTPAISKEAKMKPINW